MKLKYNFIALTFAGGLLAACDPMEDIYNEIDAQETVVTKSEEEYVLTKADYATISSLAQKDATNKNDSSLAQRVASDMALNEFAKAETYIPKVLAELYPSWGKGSTVGVTYNFKENKSETLQKYFGVKLYGLTKEDYSNAWGVAGNEFLSPAHAPEAVLPGILKNRITDAKEGSFAVVEYQYSDKEPQGKILLKEDFESFKKNEEIKIEGWKQILVKGDTKWTANVFNGVSAKFSAFKTTGSQENWLVTKAVNIDDAAAMLTFDLVLGHYNGDVLSVFVSDSYNNGDNIVKSEWTEITKSFKFPEGDPSGFTPSVNVGAYSLKDYVGKNVYFAFRYVGAGDGVTTTVQLDNISVSTLKVDTEERSDLYQFTNGDWSLYQNKEVLVVAPEDYAAMGKPGEHNNFSSSIKAEEYLPDFLRVKLPYAKEGDTQVVLYKFYKDKEKVTVIYADEYLLQGGVWALNANISVHSKETYLHNGEKWLFDPTITIAMTEPEYTILVDWVKNNKPEYIDKKYGNTEYWFGASSHYKNFNVDLGTRRTNDPEGKISKDDKEAAAYLISMVQEGCRQMLSIKYPDAPTQMSGVDLYYKVQTQVYDGRDKKIYSFRYKSLGKGNFEVAGEPEIVG